MNTYLKEHQAEAFKKIAEAMGEENVFVSNKGFNKACYCPHEFNPLENAEQWIECLFWYRNTLLTQCKEPDDFITARIGFTNVCDTREALLMTILEMINVDR